MTHSSPLPHFQSLDVEQRNRLDIFAHLLLKENRTTNLTAIRDLEGILSRHFEDSMIGFKILKNIEIDKELSGNTSNKNPRLLDVGSGAGLPGLVLAIALPDWDIVSLEATGKKTRFQRLVAKTLDLKNVFVVEGRAEELAHHPEYRAQFDVVTARAVAALPLLAELCIPFLRPGGHFLAWKSPHLEEELTTTRKTATLLGCEIVQQVPYQIALPSHNTFSSPCNSDTFPASDVFPGQIVILRKTAPTPDRFPRALSALRKRPLGC